MTELDEAQTQLDQFPFPRDAGCPFLPSKEYARRRHEEPISRLRLGTGNDPWLITRHADMVAVMGNPAVFSHNPHTPGFPHRSAGTEALVEGFLVNIDPPDHTRQKAVVMKEFSLHKIEEYTPLVRRVVAEVLDDFVAGGSPADLVSGVAYPIPGLVICDVLGVPTADQDRFLGWVSTAFDVALSAENPTAIEIAVKEFGAYVDDLLTRKQQDRSDDMIGRLVHSLEAGVINRDETLRLIRTLIVGGFDTTANTISLGTLAFLLHPDQLAKLRADPGLVPRAVEEVLRVTAITHTGRRLAAREDVEINGTLIRAGEGVIVAPDAVNRDEAIFTHPDEFDVERNEARRHSTFSFGIHFCVGAALARLEMKELFAQLFARIPTLSLATPVEDVAYRYHSANWGLDRLDVRW